MLDILVTSKCQQNMTQISCGSLRDKNTLTNTTQCFCIYLSGAPSGGSYSHAAGAPNLKNEREKKREKEGKKREREEEGKEREREEEDVTFHPTGQFGPFNLHSMPLLFSQ